MRYDRLTMRHLQPRIACGLLWIAAALLPGCPRQSADGSGPGSTASPSRPEMIDSHVHLVPTVDCLQRALAAFERNGISRFCVKSAGPPGSRRFAATVAIAARLGDRFAFFSNLDWDGIDSPDWPQRQATLLEQAVAQGARGVKIFKALGLGVRTADGRLLPVDDPRLDPLLTKAAELGVIIAMHTGDPKVFFDPPGPRNERYFELLFAPSWGFAGQDFPSRQELLAARDRLIARHPATTFLLIHLANNPEDLDYVDELLARHPNVYVDTSARLAEIGRHPADQVRAFFIKHQDRILFGSDIIFRPDSYQLGSLSIWPDDESDVDRFYQAHRAFFETSAPGLDHPTPIQGYWTIDGIGLPPEVLRKLYVTNAERLIFRKP